MSQGLLTQAWTITPNVRLTPFVSLNATAGWWFYQNHLAIKAKWVLKWTCDGVTGPTAVGDATDRLTDATKTATRATVAAAAQSWAVYSNADGVQLKITYQGATDDVLKIGYSPAVGYTLAAPATNEPTASDEVAQTGISVINSGTSLDRVMSIWVRNDGKGWRCGTFRSNAIASFIGVERTTSLCAVRTGIAIFGVPYVKFHHNVGSRSDSLGPTGPAGASLTVVGTIARVNTDASRVVTLGGGQIVLAPSSGANTAQGVFTSTKPAAQNNEGMPMLPIWWSGLQGVNTDGFFATPLDWWQAYSSSLLVPALGDSLPGYDPGDVLSNPARSNWLVALGSAAVWPWRNVAAAMEIN